jgi:hypothetical protein
VRTGHEERHLIRKPLWLLPHNLFHLAVPFGSNVDLSARPRLPPPAKTLLIHAIRSEIRHLLNNPLRAALGKFEAAPEPTHAPESLAASQSRQARAAITDAHLRAGVT